MLRRQKTQIVNHSRFDSTSHYSLTPTEWSRSRDEFSTFGTCASGAEFEASVQHTLEDINGAQLSEFQFMGSVMPPTERVGGHRRPR